MKRGAAGAAILVAAALLAGGCVTSGPDVEPKEAARANLQLGVAYLKQGNLSLAKEKLERSEKQDGRNPEVHSTLAFLYERLDRKADAEREYATARRLAPDSADIANTYGAFLCNNGKPDAGIRQFEDAARNPLYGTPWAALTNAAVCLRSAKRDGDAAPYLQQAISLRPNYSVAVTELADLQLSLGQPNEAHETINRYLSMGIASPDVLLIGVRVSQARGDAASVANYARRLRRDFPNSAQTRALPQLLNDKG
jgi:type IV pilus assembly protein PilF